MMHRVIRSKLANICHEGGPRNSRKWEEVCFFMDAMWLRRCVSSWRAIEQHGLWVGGQIALAARQHARNKSINQLKASRQMQTLAN